MAVEQSKRGPVLFWGSSNVYSSLSHWPETSAITMVGLCIRTNAAKFFTELLTATSGFYFLEAEGDRDRMYLWAYDYRSSSSFGIHLFLAA